MLDLPPIPAPIQEDYSGVPAPVDCGEPLVDLALAAPEIGWEPVYFLAGRPGALERCLLREGVARRLKEAAAALPQGYTLRVWDGLRPLSVQRSLFEDCRAQMARLHPGAAEEELDGLVDGFVARPRTDPARPAPHTTGGAVDLTLCRNGVPLDMGTEFDDTTPRARVDYFEGEPGEIRDRRRLLCHVMTEAGFVSYGEEWWHFAYGERLWALTTGNTPRYGFRKECEA